MQGSAAQLLPASPAGAAVAGGRAAVVAAPQLAVADLLAGRAGQAVTAAPPAGVPGSQREGQGHRKVEAWET